MSAWPRFFLTLSLTLLSSDSFGLDFKVTKVVALGDGTWSITPGLVKFSPNGKLVSFIKKSSLMIADTSGASRKVMSIRGRLLNYEWLSDSQIVTLEYEQLGRVKSLRRLVMSNLSGGPRKLVKEHIRHSDNQDSEQTVFRGLYRTREGMVYTKSVDEKPERIYEINRLGEFVEVGSTRLNRGAPPMREFVWGDGGLYLKVAGGNDSNWVGPRVAPVGVFLMQPVWDPDMNYAMVGGTILRVEDTSFIVLDTMLGNPPDGTYRCFFELPSLNPRFPEALFNLVCYGYESQYDHEPTIELDHVGLFDFDNNTITILDTLIGVSGCRAPTYSPNGESIALLAKGRVYIVYREMKK